MVLITAWIFFFALFVLATTRMEKFSIVVEDSRGVRSTPNLVVHHLTLVNSVSYVPLRYGADHRLDFLFCFICAGYNPNGEVFALHPATTPSTIKFEINIFIWKQFI
jgi:hypothetical protein